MGPRNKRVRCQISMSCRPVPRSSPVDLLRLRIPTPSQDNSSENLIWKASRSHTKILHFSLDRSQQQSIHFFPFCFCYLFYIDHTNAYIFQNYVLQSIIFQLSNQIIFYEEKILVSMAIRKFPPWKKMSQFIQNCQNASTSAGRNGQRSKRKKKRRGWP